MVTLHVRVRRSRWTQQWSHHTAEDTSPSQQQNPKHEKTKRCWVINCPPLHDRIHHTTLWQLSHSNIRWNTQQSKQNAGAEVQFSLLGEWPLTPSPWPLTIPQWSTLRSHGSQIIDCNNRFCFLHWRVVFHRKIVERNWGCSIETRSVERRKTKNCCKKKKKKKKKKKRKWRDYLADRSRDHWGIVRSILQPRSSQICSKNEWVAGEVEVGGGLISILTTE